MSLHFLFACMPGFHRSCSPLHSLFNPNIQTKIRRISISNNFEYLLIRRQPKSKKQRTVAHRVSTPRPASAT